MSIVFAKSKKLNDGMKVWGGGRRGGRLWMCARACCCVSVRLCVSAHVLFARHANTRMQRLSAAKGRAVSDNLPTVSTSHFTRPTLHVTRHAFSRR